MEAAKLLLADGKISSGLTRLWEEKRLGISLEAVVQEERWKPLFSDEEREKARKKLQKLGYEP